jgi:hypothetical protein
MTQRAQTRDGVPLDVCDAHTWLWGECARPDSCPHGWPWVASQSTRAVVFLYA